MNDEVSYQMDGDELVAYPDPFKVVSQEDVERAHELQNQIVAVSSQISKGYIEIAVALAEIKEKKLYKALGYESFNLWCESDQLKHIGKRTAHDLVRIANEAIPVLAKHDAMDALPMIQSSTMRALLPILADDDGEEKFVEAAYKVQDLTVKDSYAIIDEIRGRPNRFEDGELPTIFSARVRSGPQYHVIDITCLDPDDIYSMGSIKVKREHWAAWEKRFGTRFITYE